MRTRTLLGVLAAATIGCGDNERGTAGDGAGGGDSGGTIVIAAPLEPDVLFPPLMLNTNAKQVADQVFDYLADIGPELNTVGDAGFRPRLAERWEWGSDSLSIAFHLNPRARWHDGRPVRASDVRFTHSVFSDTLVASPHGENVQEIDSVSVRDSLTAVFWFKHRLPEQFFMAAYQMLILPEHAYQGVERSALRTAPAARAPVGSGRFRFARWTPGQTVEIVADTVNYRGRPKLDRVIWSFGADYAAALTKLLGGEADFYEALRADNLKEVTANANLKPLPYASMQYAFMAFNFRDPKSQARPHPLFADRALRRALTMAVDRKTLVESVAGQLGIPAHGPFSRAHPSADTTLAQIPYDPEGAKRMLDSLGWKDANGDGVREKGGRPLQFALLAPVSSQNRVRMSVIIQEQLRQAGVKVDLEHVEAMLQQERMRKRDFDAYMGFLQADPSPNSIRQSWGGGGAAPGGSNYGAYRNPTFDALADSGIASFDAAKSKGYWRRAYQTIVDDAPAVWLYEPRNHAGIHKRIRPAGIRADAYWAGLPEWSIPADERIPRDRVGLRQAPPQ